MTSRTQSAPASTTPDPVSASGPNSNSHGPARELTLDVNRADRIGFDEAIYSAGKSTTQLEAIAQLLDERGSPGFFTRLKLSQFDALDKSLRARFDYDVVSSTGVFGQPHDRGTDAQPRPAAVAVVTAGTSDVPVAREAVRTLEYYGEAVLEAYDCGVAGLWRLLERVDELREMDVIIAVAGMDAALPSVLGGLVPGAIIAVPTSTGYGVAEGGGSALNASLASCAPGVVVVNIDNGYGAACAALRIRATQRRALERAPYCAP